MASIGTPTSARRSARLADGGAAFICRKSDTVGTEWPQGCFAHNGKVYYQPNAQTGTYTASSGRVCSTGYGSGARQGFSADNAAGMVVFLSMGGWCYRISVRDRIQQFGDQGSPAACANAWPNAAGPTSLGTYAGTTGFVHSYVNGDGTCNNNGGRAATLTLIADSTATSITGTKVEGPTCVYAFTLTGPASLLTVSPPPPTSSTVLMRDDFSTDGNLVGSTPDVGGVWAAQADGAGSGAVTVSQGAITVSSASAEDVYSNLTYAG